MEIPLNGGSKVLVLRVNKAGHALKKGFVPYGPCYCTPETTKSDEDEQKTSSYQQL